MAASASDAAGGPAAARQAILWVVHSIPPGCVATYGQVAALAGLPGRSRLVGRILSQLPETSSVPWHRVIAAGGRISLPGDSGLAQRQRLGDEGVDCSRPRIDLKRHGWQPGA